MLFEIGRDDVGKLCDCWSHAVIESNFSTKNKEKNNKGGVSFKSVLPIDKFLVIGICIVIGTVSHVGSPVFMNEL